MNQDILDLIGRNRMIQNPETVRIWLKTDHSTRVAEQLEAARAKFPRFAPMSTTVSPGPIISP